MYSRKSYLKMIDILFKQHGVLSISGSSGTGKTTLAQFITGYLLTEDITLEQRAIWVQASEVFSNKRLETLFNHNRTILQYLKKNIFVIPSNVPCSDFKEQETALHKIISNESILPPGIKFIIIDNISHHLRFELSSVESLKEKSNLINIFFNSLLLPLIMKCRREEIYLILIHEISFIPKLKRERPFLYKLYDRIRTFNINLIKEDRTREKIMNIVVNYHNNIHTIKYEISNSGFIFY